MKKDKKKNLIQSALANSDKALILNGGLYEPYEVKTKYGSQTISLSDKYKIIVINDSLLGRNQTHS